MVEWVVKHPQLNTKKFSANFTLKDSQQLWENVTIILNSCVGGVGATKTWQFWRKVKNTFFQIIITQHFFNYKLFIYQCYNDIKWLTKGKVPSKASYNKTGGGDKPDSDYLSEIENTVVNMIGPTAIHGHEGIMEAEASIFYLNHCTDDTINLPLEDNEFVFCNQYFAIQGITIL